MTGGMKLCLCEKDPVATWTVWGDDPKPALENQTFADAKHIVDNQVEEHGRSDLYAQCDQHGTEYEGE